VSNNEPYKKKLIEVALPLDAINAESAREKSIRHGHPSTLHLWWARRPLAACRAVLFAQLVDDPSAHPDRFSTEEAQDEERLRLFRIIERLVKWENSTNDEVLEEARAEIRKSCHGTPPPILDPFAGGGSIPLEAQRLGLEAYASDLNPVAVLINKALVEIPPKWADRPPVHSEADNRTTWQGAEGLAEDVRRFGAWIREEAERRLRSLYPPATLTDGSSADVIAWLWARTLSCPNPACGATMPLLSTFWLGRKHGKEAVLVPHVESSSVRFSIGASPSSEFDIAGTAGEAGVECLSCRTRHSLGVIRELAKAKGLGAQMVAVVAEGSRRRHYLTPDDGHLAAAAVEDTNDDFPSSPIPDRALGFRVAAYGLTEYRDLFSDRQRVLLRTLFELVREASTRVEREAHRAGMPDPASYARDVTAYLALGVSRFSGRSSSLCIWLNQPKNEGIANVFTRPTLSMNWDFAEVNPFSHSSGNLGDNFEWIGKVLDHLPDQLVQGKVSHGDARSAPAAGRVICTDPPYYDNVGYADLSDFFYAALRPMLHAQYPDELATLQTPKAEELVSDPSRHSSPEAADAYFEGGFRGVFEAALEHNLRSDFPMTVFYAFKQAESISEDLVASTGWSTILEALLTAGWSVTATWPMRTERPGRMRSNKSNALASSIVLACRPRPQAAGITDRQGFVRALQQELPGPLHELQKAHIAPVDLRQAAIGPGMAVFSRFARVIEPDESAMRVRTALGLINQVLDQVLGEQESEFDAETRWAIHWFSQYFADDGPYGIAEQLAVSMNVAVSTMVDSGILASGGGKARLLGREELPENWDPTRDLRTPVWEATQHLVKSLEEDGETAAARLLRKLGGMGESAALLAYRLYTVCEKARPALAGPYNALVASWPEIQRLSREASEPMNLAEQQTFDA
jgi:putative DNA methylase